MSAGRIAKATLRNLLRERLQNIASNAKVAERMSPNDDNLLDLVDDLDNDLQEAIALINRVRNGEAAE